MNTSNKRKLLINDKEEIKQNINGNEINNLKIKDTSKQAIIFGRCSTKRQNEDNLHGFNTQNELCNEYAKNNKFKVIKVLNDTCSGHNINNLSLHDIIDKYYNINIIVADPSRLSRNPADGINFIMKCLDKKIIIHSARHNITTQNNEELKMFLSYIVDANTESKIFSSRIKSTIHLKKKYGSHIGIVPYGFETVKVINKYPILKLVNNEYEQYIIQLIIMLKFGSEIKPFYELVRKLLNNKSFKMFEHKKEFKCIYYGFFWNEDIANFLNKHNLLKRNKLWTKNSIYKIINDYQNNYDIEFLCSDNIMDYKNKKKILLKDYEDKDEDKDEDTVYIDQNKKIKI